MSDVTAGTATATPEKEKRTAQNYIVFRQQDGNLWEIIGRYEANGPKKAKELAVQENNLESEVRRGEVTLAVIGQRLWNPTTPKAEPQPDKLIW